MTQLVYLQLCVALASTVFLLLTLGFVTLIVAFPLVPDEGLRGVSPHPTVRLAVDVGG